MTMWNVFPNEKPPTMTPLLVERLRRNHDGTGSIVMDVAIFGAYGIEQWSTQEGAPMPSETVISWSLLPAGSVLGPEP